MNIAMSSFKIMLLKVLAATNTSSFPPLHPPPQKKSNVKVQAPVVQKVDSSIQWITQMLYVTTYPGAG